MRHLFVLFIIALAVQGCATTSNSAPKDPTADAEGCILFVCRSDGGNIQVVSEVPLEVCTSGPGYVRARISPDQVHCTIFDGGPVGMHSDALVSYSASFHRIWIHELGSGNWETITMYRCGQRDRYLNCYADEFDLTIRSDGRLDCRMRYQNRHRECRPVRQNGRW